ncbi:hypothetical protein, partial [Pectobacterium brasiliense]|uniref:hypothetical protein n=1 Tax=Pectobacterium brasiliense TaxID=180957 RepID=UPI0019695C0D
CFRGLHQVDHHEVASRFYIVILLLFRLGAKFRIKYHTYTLNNSSCRQVAREGIPMSLLK